MSEQLRPAEGEALRRLIEKWREKAKEEVARLADTPLNPTAMVATFELCADELEAALAPLSGPMDASGEPELAWLIEQPREPRYWGGDGFVANVNVAVRFARRVDAERALVPLLWRYHDHDGKYFTVVEHVWAAAVPSPPAQEKK